MKGLETVLILFCLCYISTNLSNVDVNVKSLIGDNLLSCEYHEHLLDESRSLSMAMDSIISHLKYYEGFSSTIYLDNDGSRTIGYGHHILKGEKIPNEITEEFADSLLRADFEKRLSIANRYGLDSNKALAVALFIYNCGEGNFYKSTLRQQILNGNDVSEEWIKWCMMNLEGEMVRSTKLYERREFELTVYKNDLINV